MKFYQDLVNVGENERGRAEFVRQVVAEHKATEEYRIARDAEAYYAIRNVTIEKFQRFVRDVLGRKMADSFSANYKLKNCLFRRFAIQQVQYVLSNGVTFAKEDTKEKLGADFDYKLQKAAKKAFVGGVSFILWNYDHLEVFGLADTRKDPGFAPLYDEETGALKAGVRFWVIGTNERYTLYEEDGYTEYIKRKDEEVKVLVEKKAYVTSTRKAAIGNEEVFGENYGAFPIMTMYANDVKQSELVGHREAIDCYDLISSGFANTVDEAQDFYWIIKNAGGMDDSDLMQFLDRMRVAKGASLPDGVEADAHTISIPTEAREKLLSLLERNLYKDFQIVNVEDISSGSKTATEIRAAYQPMDDKCGDFEYCIREYIAQLLAFLGIEDEPSFKWNRIANQTEETQMVLLAAQYLDNETILKKLPWLTPEEVAEITNKKTAEDVGRLLE